MTHAFVADPCVLRLVSASGAFREFYRPRGVPVEVWRLLDLPFDACVDGSGDCAELGFVARGRVVEISSNGRCVVERDF